MESGSGGAADHSGAAAGRQTHRKRSVYPTGVYCRHATPADPAAAGRLRRTPEQMVTGAAARRHRQHRRDPAQSVRRALFDAQPAGTARSCGWIRARATAGRSSRRPSRRPTAPAVWAWRIAGAIRRSLPDHPPQLGDGPRTLTPVQEVDRTRQLAAPLIRYQRAPPRHPPRSAAAPPPAPPSSPRRSPADRCRRASPRRSRSSAAAPWSALAADRAAPAPVPPAPRRRSDRRMNASSSPSSTKSAFSRLPGATTALNSPASASHCRRSSSTACAGGTAHCS